MSQFGHFGDGSAVDCKCFDPAAPAIIRGLIIAIVGNGIGIMIHPHHRYLILDTIIGIMHQIADFYNGTAIRLDLKRFNMLTLACLGIIAPVGQYIGVRIDLQQVLLIYRTCSVIQRCYRCNGGSIRGCSKCF